MGAALFLPPAARADVQEEKQRGKLPARLVRNAPPSAVPSTGEIDPGGQIGITLEAHGGEAGASNSTLRPSLSTANSRGFTSRDTTPLS